MGKLLTLAATVFLFAGTVHAGPPASYDNPEPTKLVQHDQPSDVPFATGDYLPVQYRGNTVADWADYGLPEPAGDLRWIRVENMVFLINVTSGLITEVVRIEN